MAQVHFQIQPPRLPMEGAVQTGRDTVQNAPSGSKSSLKPPITSLSQSIQEFTDQLYPIHKTLITLRLSISKDIASRAEDAIVQLKLAKKTVGDNAESLRTLLRNVYGHCGDFTHSIEIKAEERSAYFTECLDSAKKIQQDFVQYKKTFEQSLSQFDRSTLYVPPPSGLLANDTEIGPSASASTVESVDKLFSSLQSMPTHLSDVISFLADHIQALSRAIDSPATEDSFKGDETSRKMWLGYQSVLVDASSSIAKSVDAMAVEPTVHSDGTKRQGTTPLSWLERLRRIFFFTYSS